MSEFEGVIRKVDALRQDLNGRGLRQITTGVALDAKYDVRDQVSIDLGPDRRMSNWGRFKFDSGFELTSDSQAVLKPRPENPWQVLERGRRGGHKVPKGRRRRKTYRTPFGLRTATRDKPWVGSQSRGKRTWSEAVKVIDRKTPERVYEHTLKIIGRHFRR